MIVEIHGLEVLGTHGANESERRDGQTFFFDVSLELPEPAEDSLDATVDYRAVRDIVLQASAAHSYTLLESLAAATADAIVTHSGAEKVTVRVRKPGIAWAEWTAATAHRG